MGLTDQRQTAKNITDYRQNAKKITDYRDVDRHYLYFFSERRVYCIFSTFLGRNQRYHVTSLFTNIPQNEGIEIGLQSVRKFLQSNPPGPTHYMREMLRLILSSSMESSTYKPTVPQWTHQMKTAVSSVNIFMSYIETQSLS